MATIFVIVLKKYPKDHEHASIESPAAKVVSILLNGYFEKPDKTVLFIRSDIENYQAKDYQGIFSFLTNDQWSDFFKESPKFESIRKEFWKLNYCDYVAKERYSYAKRVKKDQDTWDYQEKKKYQEISSDITDIHNKIKTIEEFNRKDTILWIDHKQRTMKNFLKKTYNNLFLWKGVWRNKKLFDQDPENVPVKSFNFITSNLSKPILKNYVSQGLWYYNGEETESLLRRKNREYRGDNWKLLEWEEVFEDKFYIDLNYKFFSRKMRKEDIKLLESSYSSYLEKYIFNGKEKEYIIGGNLFFILSYYRVQMHNDHSSVF